MKQLCIPAKAERLPEVTAFLTELGGGASSSVLVAAEEVFINIASYAYTGTGLVTLRAGIEGDCFVMEFADEGVPFNPLTQPPPDRNLPIEHRAPGGLGILLVKELMDDIQYHQRNGKNVLLMSKKIL